MIVPGGARPLACMAGSGSLQRAFGFQVHAWGRKCNVEKNVDQTCFSGPGRVALSRAVRCLVSSARRKSAQRKFPSHHPPDATPARDNHSTSSCHSTRCSSCLTLQSLTRSHRDAAAHHGFQSAAEPLAAIAAPAPAERHGLDFCPCQPLPRTSSHRVPLVPGNCRHQHMHRCQPGCRRRQGGKCPPGRRGSLP
ncbi:hypothetical protein IG631_13560 [Alternaria alternata]|nr:hypothetical protein IG631_13560 [Alternaria alternata]